MQQNNGDFIKYPKTYHIEDYTDSRGSLASLLKKDQKLVVEEKMDGTQVGISFDNQGKCQIQSRGTIITSEQEFSLLKQWCWQHQAALVDTLADRFILFGEWLYAKHTMYYDCLPDYFLEFDIYDRHSQQFLSTVRRNEMLESLTFLHSVKVLAQTTSPDLENLKALIQKSSFTSELAYDSLSEQALLETDTSGLMEGLYLKVESDSMVAKRFKLVRAEFIQCIVESQSHWRSRELVTNRLRTTD